MMRHTIDREAIPKNTALLCAEVFFLGERKEDVWTFIGKHFISYDNVCLYVHNDSGTFSFPIHFVSKVIRKADETPFEEYIFKPIQIPEQFRKALDTPCMMVSNEEYDSHPRIFR